MKESFKYIEALHDVGHPTVSIGEDFQHSYDSISKYWSMLDGLDYDMMFAESRQPNAKEILEEWKSTEWNHTGLSLEKLFNEAKDIWFHGVKGIFGDFAKHHGGDFYGKGKWADEEWRDFQWICDNTQYLWDKRINELCSAFKYPSLQISHANPVVRPETIVNMFRYQTYCDEFFDISDMTKCNISQWGKKARRYVRDKKLSLNHGDRKRLFLYIIEEYPHIKTNAADEGFSGFRQACR